MFTKQDYEDYFQILEDREKDMLANISLALQGVDDDQVKTVFAEIREEEKVHVGVVLGLRKALAAFYESQQSSSSEA
jgi:hypothetical protein